jgi:hypothetical protein
MNSHFLGGVAAPVFFGSVSPLSAAIVGVTFTGTLPRTLIGLTVDEAAEFERYDRLSPVDHLGNCLWGFEGDPKTPDEKRCLEFYRKLETALSTWPAAEGRWLHWLVARSQ